MRDFFIRGFETILSVLIVLGVIAVVGGALAALFGMQMGDLPGAVAPLGQRIGVALAILVGGLAYLIVVGGLAFLGLGIYHNTKRTAELLEARGGRP